ncbi:MAG: cyclic-di-AMP receptor [Clostridia bacterium]|nr:cyclic-di-AMP receptor [Clostridia bacterium]
MKLVIAIVNRDDSSDLIHKLNKSGFTSTKLSTTGGFLRAGNITLLIGVEEEKVQAVIDIIAECCSQRVEIVTSSAGNCTEHFFASLPVEVTVGGATVFVVDVEKFIKL